MAYSDVQDTTAGAAGAAPTPAWARPASVVPAGDGLCGLGGLISAWVLVLLLRPHPLLAAWLVLLATAVPMLVRELRRAAPGVRAAAFSPLAWLAGFVVAAVPFALVHAQGAGLTTWWIAWFVAAPAFVLRFIVEAARKGGVAGGFPAALGQALLPPDRAGLRALAGPARLWALKAFFVPLYGASLFGLTQSALATATLGPPGWLALAVIFAYTIDLAFALSGYVFASNDLAPTVKSTQTLVLGWIVCILCYRPAFVHWPAFGAVVGNEIGWPRTLTATPLTIIAAAAMLALLGLYVSATVAFGLRFSNLSNRGVVTSGPYRLMKHPAYFAHVGNAWIIGLVLLPAAGIDLGLAHILVPMAFTILYRLRAVTEEKHMSEDSDYVAYAGWIAQHGVLAQLGRRLRPAR